jgi:hypothetical protein
MKTYAGMALKNIPNIKSYDYQLFEKVVLIYKRSLSIQRLTGFMPVGFGLLSIAPHPPSTIQLLPYQQFLCAGGYRPM